MVDVHGCIAHPCTKKRAKGSGFCSEHKKAHEKSPWVKSWRAYQKECARVGFKNAVWSLHGRDADEVCK